MSTITRERAEIKSFITGFLSDPAHDNQSSRSMTAEVFRIALASLEAEASGRNPVLAYADSYRDMAKQGVESIPVWSVITDLERNIAPLFTTPPAPVSDEDLLQMAASAIGDLLSNKDRSGAGVWADIPAKLRRAAMLQGADGNSPVVPDGWVACSERMPDIGTEIFYFCQDDDLRDCGIVSSANFSDKGDAQLYVHAEGYDLRLGVEITHWMPLPAAPQQHG